MRQYILLLLLILLTTAGGVAQSPFRPFRSAADSAEAIGVVARFYAVPDSAYLDSTEILSLLGGDLVSRTVVALGRPVVRPSLSFPWRIDQARLLNSKGDSTAIVSVPTVIDTVPRYGPTTVDMIYYLRRTPTGWRIFEYHRQLLIEGVIGQLRGLDTSNSYPPSLKPIIVREVSAMLLSNGELRAHFARNRTLFDSLARAFRAERNLRRLARIDRRPEQINNVAIMWMNSAQDVPKEAIAEFEKTLDTKDLRAFRESLAAQTRLRKIGEDSVVSITRRLKINRHAMDEILRRMQTLRLTFLNTDLPWKDAIQCTVAGAGSHSLGYLYAPRGELPMVSSREYFYLEELQGGWWIFRAR